MPKTENESSRNEEQKSCKICMDDVVCMAFLPCGHLVTCENCSRSLKICPICQKTIKGTLKTYMS